MYRYRRWQYQREMALPVPQPRQTRTGWRWRAWRRVRHPLLATRHWKHALDEAKPVPQPLTQAERRGGPVRRTYRRIRVRLSHERHNFVNWPLTGQVVGCLVMSGVLVGAFFGAKSLIGRNKSA